MRYQLASHYRKHHSNTLTIFWSCRRQTRASKRETFYAVSRARRAHSLLCVEVRLWPDLGLTLSSAECRARTTMIHRGIRFDMPWLVNADPTNKHAVRTGVLESMPNLRRWYESGQVTPWTSCSKEIPNLEHLRCF